MLLIVFNELNQTLCRKLFIMFDHFFLYNVTGTFLLKCELLKIIQFVTRHVFCS